MIEISTSEVILDWNRRIYEFSWLLTCLWELLQIFQVECENWYSIRMKNLLRLIKIEKKSEYIFKKQLQSPKRRTLKVINVNPLFQNQIFLLLIFIFHFSWKKCWKIMLITSILLFYLIQQFQSSTLVLKYAVRSSSSSWISLVCFLI